MMGVSRTSIVLLLFIVYLFCDHAVQAKFRGAKPKAIPSLSADGGVMDTISGVWLVSSAVVPCRKYITIPSITQETPAFMNTGLADGRIDAKGGGRGTRRTKAGLLPWWVRKRLQEQAGNKRESIDKQLYKSSRKGKKTLHKNVQVRSLCNFVELSLNPACWPRKT